MSTRWFALLLFVAILGVASTPAHAQTYSKWQYLNPYPTVNPLNAIWGTAPDNVFAAGNGGTVLHYDGTAWRVMETNTTANLIDIWGWDGNRIFAGGDENVVLSYNGNEWSQVNDNGEMDIHAIWGSNNADSVWFGGISTLPFFSQHPFYKRRVGSGWVQSTYGDKKQIDDMWGTLDTLYFVGKENGIATVWQMPTVGNPFPTSSWTFPGEILNGIWGTSHDDVWVCGWFGSLYHWDGATWTDTESNTGKTIWELFGWAADNVIGVGEDGGIIRYNGTDWDPVPNLIDGNVDLTGVWGSAPDDIFVVGRNFGGAQEIPVIAHYDSVQWEYHTMDQLPDGFQAEAIWGTDPNNLIVVGAGADSAAHHFDGNRWTAGQGLAPNDLHDIWGTGSDAFVVGEEDLNGHGVVGHFNGTVWNTLSNSHSGDLIGVWGTSASNVYFANPSSLSLLRWNGAAITLLPTQTSAEPCAITGFGGSPFISGRGNGVGDFMKLQGDTLIPMGIGPTNGDIPDIYAISGNEVYAVSNVGANDVWRFDGNSWSSETNAAYPLNGVWGHATAGEELIVVAVGDRGQILKSTDGSWVAQEFGYHDDIGTAKSNYKGVWGMSKPGMGKVDVYAYIVGGNQVLVNTDVVLTTPILIQRFDVRPEANRINLAWHLFADEAFLGFRIYRKEFGDSYYSPLGQGALLSPATSHFYDNEIHPGKKYTYRLAVVKLDGGEVLSMERTAGVPEAEASLKQNYPNPFNPITTIEYSVPFDEQVTIQVFDVQGRLVRELLDKEMPAGLHEVLWNGTNNAGVSVSSGLYFYRARIGSAVRTKRMVLLK